jgi:N-acetylmuramoyl-L-alanine amidase
MSMGFLIVALTALPKLLCDSVNAKEIKKTAIEIVSEEATNLVNYSRNNEEVIVYIDPGHGGQDPGAVNTYGITEKQFTLPVAFQIKSALQKYGIKALLTREADEFLSLKQRVSKVNEVETDAFVSIHANASPTDQAWGIEILYNKERDKPLVASVRSALAGEFPEITIRPTPDPKEINSLYILRETNSPSIIIECGFITNSKDIERLISPYFQKQIATAITLGIVNYLKAESFPRDKKDSDFDWGILISRIDIIIPAGLGVIFLFLLILLAIFIRSPTALQLFIFRTIIALAAAGFASAIPGLLNVSVDAPGLTIRAVGALGTFLIIYFFNPPLIQHNDDNQ